MRLFQSITKTFSALILAFVPLVIVDTTFAEGLVSGVNEHVDKTGTGTIGNATSGTGTLSHDGRYVAFSSTASNLVVDDTNGTWDIFVRDRAANTITRVSVDSNGAQANGNSQGAPSISGDGRYIVFTSTATNLVTNDTNAAPDVFIHDMQTGTTQLVSASSSGIQGNNISQTPQISGNGRFVVFNSYATNLVSPAASTKSDVYVKDLVTNSTQLLSINTSGGSGNNHSFTPSISCDGDVIAFASIATDLQVTPDTNGGRDIFIVTRGGSDSIENITINSNGGVLGSLAPQVSCDGLSVAFKSDFTNLVSSDTNGNFDIFKYDRQEQSMSLVSVNSSGDQSNAGSDGQTISSDGRLVAFSSMATNLVPNDTNGVSDVFLRDTSTGRTSRVSVDSTGNQGNAPSHIFVYATFSKDSKYLTFNSGASNLISGDINNNNGVFLAHLLSVTPDTPSLIVDTPTQQPLLSWVADADSYNIYRNGVNIDATTANTYTDVTATEGTHTYYVTAINSGGESGPSNSVEVLVDQTAPTITANPDPAANADGWNNTDVIVTFTCDDVLSGIKSCSDPITVSAEGQNQTITGTAIDNAGNSTSVNVTDLSIDKTTPTITDVIMSNTSVIYGSGLSTTFTATAVDGLSGITNGEFYIDVDPGLGNGQALAYANNQLGGTADLSDLSVGTHTLYMRAQDAAGNWSTVASTNFTVDYPVPLTPTNLTGTTPTNQSVSLSWSATFDPSTPPATSYNIYRNNVLIGTSTTTSFVDNGLSTEGTYTYHVTAVNQYDVESNPSNLLVVVYDTTAPTVIYTLNPAANTAGWNNTDVTATFSCSDSLSGVQTCPGAFTFGGEGANQSTATSASDNAGNVTNVAISGINIDKTAPTVTNVAMSSTVVTSIAPVNISADTIDTLSGVTAGEYYVDTDPGQGLATPMTYSNGQLSASRTFSGLGLGQHTLYIRAKDVAGNWSTAGSVTFTVVCLPLLPPALGGCG